MNLTRIRYWLLTALNAGAAVTLLFVILDRSPATRFPIADFGALYGSLLLFVLIPLGLAGILLLSLAPGPPAPKSRRVYVHPDTPAVAQGEPQGTRVSRILWLDVAGRTVFYKEQRELRATPCHTGRSQTPRTGGDPIDQGSPACLTD